jgi:dTDP-4-dehydrorhamnose 3,5-epimerase
MRVIETGLKEVVLVEPERHEDSRGLFYELYHQDKYTKIGIPDTFVQDNVAQSKRDVLRGLHYQLRYPQGKLVMAVQGTVFDVAVDIRRGSPSFGQWCGFELSAANMRQLYIPPGFAHGYCVLTDTATVVYKCSRFYAPDDDHGIIWNDPTINITWPIVTPVLSAKDRALKTLAESQATVPEYKA